VRFLWWGTRICQLSCCDMWSAIARVGYRIFRCLGWEWFFEGTW